MLIHIVKTGETVDKISDSYRILKSDLISNNLHITDFSHLKSGMKLKIPLISKDVIESLEESEAFIDDYYPSFEKFLNNNNQVVNEVEVKNEEVNLEEIKPEEPKEIVEEKPKEKETVEKERKTPNNNVFQYNNSNYYSGNITPKYNEKFIKKI